MPRLRSLVALGVLLATLSACMGAPVTVVAPTTAPVEQLVLAAAADAAVTPMHQMIISGLAEKELGLQIQWLDLSYDTLRSSIVQGGEQHSAAYDLVMLDDPWVPEFALKGYIADLTKLGYTADAGFVPSTLAVGYWPPQAGPRVPGIAADAPPHIHALPIIADTQLFFYRKDLIKQPPETWDDLLALSKQADPAQQRYLLAMRGAAGNPIVTEWFPYLYSFGGEVFDAHVAGALQLTRGRRGTPAVCGPDEISARRRGQLQLGGAGRVLPGGPLPDQYRVDRLCPAGREQ